LQPIQAEKLDTPANVNSHARNNTCAGKANGAVGSVIIEYACQGKPVRDNSNRELLTAWVDRRKGRSGSQLQFCSQRQQGMQSKGVIWSILGL